jgi:hypothetical protein
MSDEDRSAGQSAPGAGTPNAAPPTPAMREFRRGAAAFGVLLIVVGVLVLAGRFVPGLDVLRLWPLLVVAVGVMEMVRTHGDAVVKRVAEGAGTISVGLVLLGNSFGAIPWTVWLTILSLWPLLLVAIGIEFVGRGLHSDWVRALSNVVLIAGLAYGVFVLGPGFAAARPLTNATIAGASYQDSVPHEPTLTTGDAAVKVGAVSLSIGPGSDLAAISGKGDGGHAAALTTLASGGVAHVDVSDPGGFLFVPSTDRQLAVSLDRTVPWRSLTMDIGAAQVEADLRDLSVSDVALNVGASAVRIWVGIRAPHVHVHVSGGVTAVTVLVPAAAAVTVDSKSGLSAVGVPATFRHLSGIPAFGESTWASDGTGGPNISIDVASGMASLDIQTY